MVISICRRMKAVLFIASLCFLNSMLSAADLTETFEGVGFLNHQDFSSAEKISVGQFDYLVQTNGSLKTVIAPAAISLGFDRAKPVTRFTISSINSDAFSFRGFTASNQFEMSETVNVSGFLNGALVTSIISVTIPWPVSSVDFSALAGFDNVDEVRFENSDLYFIFEDWQYTSKEAQAIVFVDPADLSFIPSGTFIASATSSSSLPVTIISNTTSVCRVVGQIVIMVRVGICQLTASQTGDANFKPAINVNQSVIIGKTNQTISFTPPPSKKLGDDPFIISATASSGLSINFTSTTTSICTVSGNTVSLINIGTCTIAADQSGDSNHAAAPQVTANITINRTTQVPNSVPTSIPTLSQWGVILLSIMLMLVSWFSVSRK